MVDPNGNLIVPAQYPRRNNVFARWFGKTLLRIGGWRVVGVLPDLPKVVVIVAPHTSNWDFVVGVATLLALDIKISFLGKHSLFSGLFGKFMRAIGGIPVDRAQPHGIVGETVAAIQNAEKIVFALSPEGTRKLNHGFKTGFLHIAHGAKVPICLAYFDFENKHVGFGPVMIASGDVTADMAKVLAFYRPIRGKYLKAWQREQY